MLGDQTVKISNTTFDCRSKNVIYALNCNEHPNNFYIGETKTEIKRRFYQHRSTALKSGRGERGAGGIHRHFSEKPHENAQESLQICPIEQIKKDDTVYRRFRESGWVARFNPPMNKDTATISLDMGL
jgi:hypothetical protein